MSMSIIPDSSPDSVENEKDFAPPTKKSKVDKDDLVEEEHNTDSVTSLSDRQIFDIWCKFFRVTYKDEKEKLYRFGIFQKAIKLDKTEDELHPNYQVLADHTEEELKGCCNNPYISQSYVDYMMQLLEHSADHRNYMMQLLGHSADHSKEETEDDLEKYLNEGT